MLPRGPCNAAFASFLAPHRAGLQGRGVPCGSDRPADPTPRPWARTARSSRQQTPSLCCQWGCSAGFSPSAGLGLNAVSSPAPPCLLPPLAVELAALTSC